MTKLAALSASPLCWRWPWSSGCCPLQPLPRTSRPISSIPPSRPVTSARLVAAVQAAGLVDTLKGDGPFTVFAPTDEAFAKLPAGTVDALLADPEGALKQILLYHVVPGKVLSSDLSDGMEAATVQGENVKFTLGDGKAMVNDANIVAADIETSNGVIHVIDSVILPPSVAAAAR